MSKHSAVIAAFGRNCAKTRRVPREFHRFLIEAQESRILSDYDPSIELEESDAALHIARAAQFLQFGTTHVSTDSRPC